MTFTIAILFWANGVSALDVSGKWSGTISNDNSSDSLLLILQQDGTNLTGTGGPSESQQRPLENARTEGDVITFQVRAGSGILAFDLRIKGDEITGTVEVKRNDQTLRSARVSLKRQ